MKQQHILIASAYELVEPISRESIEEDGQNPTILKLYEKRREFLTEAESAHQDGIVRTTRGPPLDYLLLGLVSPLHLGCNARAIVMAGMAETRKGSPWEIGLPFYLFPMSGRQILEAV
jgi:hypothetical protein